MPQSIQFNYSIVVENILVPPANINIPNAVVGVPYSYQMPQPAGGLAPYHWSATGLPAGLSISDSGLISGTPTTAETSSVSFTVTDSTV